MNPGSYNYHAYQSNSPEIINNDLLTHGLFRRCAGALTSEPYFRLTTIC
jgi:hypothetical protein